MSELSERYDLRLMAAFVRGALTGGSGADPETDGAMRSAQLPSETVGAIADPALRKPLDELDEADCARLLALAERCGVRAHTFKRQPPLPRVRMALGFLRGVAPQSLLDVGSGRGVFLFPFLRAFPGVPVTALDLLERRVDMLSAMARGGVEELTALRGDICTWDAPDGSFDVVTLLEVLEHIPDVAAAVRNAVRLARRYVVVSVPSKPDDNPEHIHLLTKPVLTDLFRDAGCARLSFDGVPGHLFLTAKL